MPDTTTACFSIYRNEGLYRGDSSFQAVQAGEVDAVLLIAPDTRTVTWLALDELRTVYATAERSALLHLSADDVSAHLPWNLIEP